MSAEKSADENQKSETTKRIENHKLFDVIVLGGGAAGLSAALWCDELGLSALLLEAKTELGGQLLRVYNPIKNHLGTEAENGRALRDAFIKQIETRKFTIHAGSPVSKVDPDGKNVFLESGEKFSAKALIIAAGVRRRKLNVEGEEEYKDRGIIESGSRDPHSVVGKSVCIVGGGDAALENALILSETATRVYLVHRRAEFRARPEFLEKVLANTKVKIFTETTITKISGRGKIEAVELRNLKTGEAFTLPVEALLTRIGVEPNTELFREKIILDANGYVEINSRCETSVENVFAVGDVANPTAPTVSSAVGMGATAAKVIYVKLNSSI